MWKSALLITLAFALRAAPPRPEFPEPQFQRELWENLNGPWEFEFDDANQGLDAGWASGDRKFSRTITVPFCFESRMSGIGDTSFHPWVWYRRSLTIPDEWKGRRVLLHFGAVDYRAMVWINGRLAGRHEGGNVPFAFDITPLLKAGGNVVTVRADDPPTDRAIPRGKQYWEPKSRAIFYTRTSGIWQTVWMEPVAESHLERVRITPALDGTVRFEASIVRPQPDLEFHVTVRRGREVASSTMTRAGGSPTNATLAVNDPRLWSPQSPNLYEVALELRRGATVIDHVNSYFGFRSVTAEQGRVLLNGRPVYLKLVLDQGYWPESILTPPSDEAIQYDIRLTKEMGFNGARKHQKIEDPRFLYWADRMGFLVSGEMANAQAFNDEYVGRFTREWLEAVARDYNHPSIIVWAPINESWGVPNLREPRQQFHLKELYTLTHALDSTRLVIDNEGWEHTDMTDLLALHDYARTGDLLFEKYKDLGKPGMPVPASSRAALIPGYTANGSPFYLSEFGGIAYIPPGTEVPQEAWGYSGVEKTAGGATERLRGIYGAIAKLPFAGICYTQITDVEQEINWLMTYDRKPKFDSKALREMNELLH
jgi:beta-galactosidase/beta-glucuronidase